MQDFFDKIDNILFSDIPDEERDEALASLKLEFSNRFPVRDSNYHYFLGYAGYLAKDLGKETEAYFKEAMSLDPKNDFCQYYNAYFLFDSRRFKEALKVLEDIDLAHFEELGITWRIFKIKEAVACCSLFLAGYTEQDRIEKINKFLTEYENHVMIEENNYSNPINYPQEIIHSVGASLDRFGENFKPTITRIVELIKREKLDTAYSSAYNKLIHFLTV